MKRLICMLSVFLIGISAYAFAETLTTVSERNEYGGKTAMLTFSPGDKIYEDGVAKSILYFDSNGKRIKLESYYTDESVGKNGKATSMAYLDSNEEPVKLEYYDNNGKLLETVTK